MASEKKTSNTTNSTMSGTTNSLSNGTSTSTFAPSNPAWVDGGLAGLGGQVTNLAGQDPYKFVAGADPLQTQAGQGAAGLTTSPNFAMGSALTQAGATGGPNLGGGPASLLDGLGRYMSPYTDNVVNSTLAGFDQSAGYSRAGDALARANDITFGGSGGAIGTALNEQNIRQDRALTEAQLRDQAFQTAAGLSGQDAARRQQSGQFDAGQRDADLQRLLAGGSSLASIGQAQGADARANIDTQSGIGAILQQLAQAKAGAPINTLAGLSGIFAGLPLDLLHGGTTTGATTGSTTGTQTGTTNSTSTGKESGASMSDWLSFLKSAAQAAAASGAGGGGGG